MARSRGSEHSEAPQEGAEQQGAKQKGPKQKGSQQKGVRQGVRLPSLGLRGTGLFLWRQLTSMQTALILLMLLAVAAVPGSLYPQRSVDPSKTEAFLTEHPTWGKVLDTLGFFNVFSSAWFSAIYLLLFISLIGCVIPRLGVLIRQLRSRPPRTPRRLDRFVGYTRIPIAADAAPGALTAAEKLLRSRRYRLDVHDESAAAEGADAEGASSERSSAHAAAAGSTSARSKRAGSKRAGSTSAGSLSAGSFSAGSVSAGSVSAERGYLREAGNLLFHVALLGVLVGVALGHLTQYRGQITVVEGEGFSNSLASYDSFQSGPWFDRSQLPDFRFTLKDFRAEYDSSPSEHEFGQPRKFEADVAVDQGDGSEETSTIRVNQPLHVDGADMYLLGNGYAPEITVTDPQGNVVAQGAVITIPRDSMYTSQLVLKAPDAQPEQLAVVGIFMPTAIIDDQGPHSQYPDLVDPQLALSVYTGDLGLDSGVPENAYQIDLSSLTAVTSDDGSPALLRMKPGEKAKLPDGTQISFDGVKRYAAFDVKHDPFQVMTLVMALLAVGGLTLSLFVPRRRIWVRVRPEGEMAVLEVAGLARSEDHQLHEAVADIVRRLTDAVGEDPASPAEPAAPTGSRASRERPAKDQT